MQLARKVAIVTGGASGIGKAICTEFAREGACVVVADVNAEGAQGVASEIAAMGRSAIAATVDVASFESVIEATRKTVEAYGTIDILVNCAGINTFMAPEATAVELWKKIQSVNIDGPWYFCKAVMDVMMKKRSGKIINIGSAAAVLGIPKAIPYTAAKHGLVGLTRALAVDLGPYNINVNCICPATVITPLAEQATSTVFFDEMRKRIPLGRLGKPEDIAMAALFLASPASDWITGVTLPVDGGLVCCVRSRHYE